MRLQNDVVATHVTPRTNKTSAGFDKVDRTLHLRAPNPFNHSILGFVYLHEAARRQQWIHREIFCAYIAVGISVIGKRREISERHHAPLLDHSRHISCPSE